jgi:hypothetical protein
MLITLLLVLVVFAVVWYLVNSLLPVDPRFIRIIDIVLVVILIVYLLSLLPGVRGLVS